MKLKLPDGISSIEDLREVLLEIAEYARWMSHDSIKSRLGAKHASAPPVISPVASELLRTWEAKKSITTQSLDGLMRTLENIETSAPTITITLAAPPTTGVKATLVAWCRNNISPNILITFHFNATLLGGMVVRYGSRIFDWSFRRQILDARTKFPEILRNV